MPSEKHSSGWWHTDRQKNRWSLKSLSWLYLLERWILNIIKSHAVEQGYIMPQMALVHCLPELPAIFVKNLPCFIFFLVQATILLVSFNLSYLWFFSILWNSAEEFLSLIACDITSLKLSNFVWEWSLIKLFFLALRQRITLISKKKHLLGAVIGSCNINQRL